MSFESWISSPLFLNILFLPGNDWFFLSPPTRSFTIVGSDLCFFYSLQVKYSWVTFMPFRFSSSAFLRKKIGWVTFGRGESGGAFRRGHLMAMDQASSPLVF